MFLSIVIEILGRVWRGWFRFLSDYISPTCWMCVPTSLKEVAQRFFHRAAVSSEQSKLRPRGWKRTQTYAFLININTSIRDLWTPKVSYTLWEGLESSKEENSLSVLQWIYHLMRIAMGISLDLLYNLKALHKTMLFLWKSTQLFLLSSPIMLVYSVIWGGISVLFFFFFKDNSIFINASLW